MIFTKDQWHRVYQQYRANNDKNSIRPPEIILSIMEHDALEHGIHPDWIDYWINPKWGQANSRWANALFVMLRYEKGRFLHGWDKPMDKR